MPGRVDDVDAVALPGDGGVLGQDRDATFLFLVVAVHHALGEHGAFGERARLLEQAVDEGGLAMVDVGEIGRAQSEPPSIMRTPYDVLCFKKNKKDLRTQQITRIN